ncbi:precorrin-3B synthase [Streptodolium elevatio]
MDSMAGSPGAAAARPIEPPADGSPTTTGASGVVPGRVRQRADACPGTVDAAPADDGLVARVRLPGGRISPAQLTELAAVAAALGTGSVDLTARANVQVRGLSADGVGELGRRLARAGLLPSPTHDRVRNIVASPFAGRAPGALVDGDELVTSLDAALCTDPELASLSGRFQFAVDDGTLPVATARHDVALVAVAPGVVALRVAGVDTGLYGTSPHEAVTLATAAARAFVRASEASGAWHVRELPGGAEELVAALGGGPVRSHESDGASHGGPAPRTRQKRVAVGVLPQADGRFGISALVPLGRLTQAHLAVLAGFGAHGFRLRIAPWRGVVVGDVPEVEGREVGVREVGVREVVAALDAVGLPSDTGSPWLGVSACSGLGECRRAGADVRSLARDFVARRSHDDGTAVHFAACERGCGRPPGASLVLADGAFAETDADTDAAADAATMPGVSPARSEPLYPAHLERSSWTTG